MAGNEGVMDALVGLWKAGETIQLPQRGKKFLSPCQCLVYIGLMANVKYQPVMRRIKHTMDGYSQFYNAHIGRKMSAGFRHVFQQKLPQLRAELWQLFLLKCPDILRGMNYIQNLNDLPRSNQVSSDGTNAESAPPNRPPACSA